jgi:signal transduction histidine kinase
MWSYIRRRNTIDRQEAKKRELNETLLQSKLEISEQTIQGIRHEIHNNMGQMASLIKLNLNNLPLQDHDPVTVKIEETKGITQQLINDLKSLSLSLGTENLSHSGLDKALETEAELSNKAGRVNVTFLQEGNLPLLDHVRTIILFRLSQVIMHFRINHGKAKHLSILLQGLENVVILSFDDDGSNADEDLVNIHTGDFLSVLEKKTKPINARLLTGSTSRGKNGIRIEMPL